MTELSRKIFSYKSRPRRVQKRSSEYQFSHPQPLQLVVPLGQATTASFQLQVCLGQATGDAVGSALCTLGTSEESIISAPLYPWDKRELGRSSVEYPWDWVLQTAGTSEIFTVSRGLRLVIGRSLAILLSREYIAFWEVFFLTHTRAVSFLWIYSTYSIYEVQRGQSFMPRHSSSARWFTSKNAVVK